MSAEEEAEVFILTNRAAVVGHVETAITLWFEEKDASSIHTLAVAAQGNLNQMCKEKNILVSQINALIKAQSKAIRNSLRAPQNFYKHGRYTGQRRKEVGNAEMWTELILADCLSMHHRLFGTLTPMMHLFALRYSLFNPGAFPIKMTLKGVRIEDLRRFTRPQFLKEVLPRLTGQVGDLPPKTSHWEESPG